MAKKTSEDIMKLMNAGANARMMNLSEEDDGFYDKHGYRKPVDHETQDITEIAENLISVAKRIYDYRIAIALGEKPKEALNHGFIDYQQYIIDLVEPMIKDYQQTKNIDAKSASEVIKLLGKGKVTPREAIELLTVIGKTIEVEEKEMKKELQKTLLDAVDNKDNNKCPDCGCIYYTEVKDDVEFSVIRKCKACNCEWKV